MNFLCPFGRLHEWVHLGCLFIKNKLEFIYKKQTNINLLEYKKRLPPRGIYHLKSDKLNLTLRNETLLHFMSACRTRTFTVLRFGFRHYPIVLLWE